MPRLFEKLKALDVQNMRLAVLFFTLALYAVLGSPTPDNPGVVEGLIAFGLVLTVGLGGFYRALFPRLDLPLWEGAGRVLLLFGLSVPLVAGLAYGNDTGLIIRDIAPFLFLLLPIFLSDLSASQREFQPVVICGALLIGVCFAARSFAEAVHILSPQMELTYFANMPTVLFAALFCVGVGAYLFSTAKTLADMASAPCLMGVSLFICAPIFLSGQRASLGYLALFVLILTIYGLWRHPRRTAVLVMLAGLALMPFYDVISGAAHAMGQKTALVGFNMRFEEFAAVWHEISGNPFSLLFGTGWGGGFESPAVAGVRVNFTHNLFSSALLKTGLVGCGFVLVYIAGMAQALWRGVFARPILALALAGPFAIDVLLYASFKSLDFGLILLLITTLGVTHEKAEH